MEKIIQFNGSERSSMAYLFAYFTSATIKSEELLQFLQKETDYLGIGAKLEIRSFLNTAKRIAELKIINNAICLKVTYAYNDGFCGGDNDIKKAFAKIIEDKDSIIEQVSTLIEFLERSKKIKN
ncbi:MAG: hypothetical protein V1865_00045 [bacterium]